MKFNALENLIQQDPGDRGLARVPGDNLCTRTAGDLEAACRTLATTEDAVLWVVTGFFIPGATVPAAETDGPLGAVFLARTLPLVGIRVALVSDPWCLAALGAGLDVAGVSVPVLTVTEDGTDGWRLRNGVHLLALERVGPGRDGRCRNSRGVDNTELHRPVHRMFEQTKVPTIGIGDGGNEIGMGKIPQEVIAANIPHGDRIACRTATDRLIVAGVSNWGAYALAAGVGMLKGGLPDTVWDANREREILAAMVERGPLVDGKTGQREATVDGLGWQEYASVLKNIPRIIGD